MASNRSTQLTRQIGEHLVVAELGRMGFLATPFAGNVPNFDLLVANEAGLAIPVQVKAINGISWQFNATTFLDIEIKDGVQTVLGPKPTPNPGLVYVLVLLGGAGKDEFFTLKFKDLQDHFASIYKSGKRPKKPESTHCAVWPRELQNFKNWNALLVALETAARTSNPSLERTVADKPTPAA
jgi:hypothetical protein